MSLSTIFQLYCGRSVLLVQENGGPRENNRPATTHGQTLSNNVVSSTPLHERDLNSYDCFLKIGSVMKNKKYNIGNACSSKIQWKNRRECPYRYP